jgi:hypothetical protein
MKEKIIGVLNRIRSDRTFWIAFGIFLVIAIGCNLSYLLAGFSEGLKVFMIPENQPIVSQTYIPALGGLGNYAWNDYYSGGSFGSDPLSFRTTYWAIGSVLGLQTIGIIALEKFSFQFLAFLGAFVLIRYYLRKRMEDELTICMAAILGALVYGLNPSYLLGDSFWVSIQLSLTSLPWIVWTFSKTALDDKWIYLPICALIMAVNVDEHFLWAGFPILLFMYTIYCYTARKGGLKNRFVGPTIAFFAVMFLYVSLIAYRLIFRLTSTSSLGLALSTSGLSDPWSNATMYNMLLASSHMSLPPFYVVSSNPFSLLNYLFPATILITALAFYAVYRYSKYNEVLFYSFIIILFILFFYVDSPFKGVNEFLFFSTPIGPAFRTWRVSDALVALSLSVLSSYSLFFILGSLKRRKIRILRKKIPAVLAVIIVFVLLVSVYSWPLLFTNPSSSYGPVDIPIEFQNAGRYLDSVGDDYRAVYLPSYGQYKPVWSPSVGSYDIWTFSSDVPTILFGTNWNHYGDYALDTFYSASMFHNQDVESLAAFAGWANIGYLVIHDDTVELEGLVHPMISKLQNSSSFEQVFHQGMIYIFKNLGADYRISTNQDLVLADGGYRLMDQFMKSTDYVPKFSYDFIGQGVNLAAIDAARYIISDKNESQMMESLTYMEAMATANQNVSTIYPYDQVLTFDPSNEWSRGSYWDPHQNEWHPYVDWPRYSFDFEMMRGVVFTIGSSDSVNLKITPDHSGDSYLILRYFSNEKGGSIQVSTDGVNQTIDTYSDYDGFLLAKIPVVAIEGNTMNVAIKNLVGFNGLTSLSIVPLNDYESASEKAQSLLSSKIVYKMGIDSLVNPSFDYGDGGWNVSYSINGSTPILLPLSEFIDQEQTFDGEYSLKFVQNKNVSGVETYQIISDDVAIEKNKTYSLTAGILPYGLIYPVAHIVYLDQEHNPITQVNLSLNQTNIFNAWRSNETTLDVPTNASYVRVEVSLDINNNGSDTWKCWVDNVRLLSADKVDLSNLDTYSLNVQTSFTRISPVEYRIVLTNVTNQAIVSFRESYDPNWVLTLDNGNDGTVSGFVNDGIINGFVVNGNGTLSLTLYYTQQNNIEIGYWLSYIGLGIAVSAIAIGLIRNWRKRK